MNRQHRLDRAIEREHADRAARAQVAKQMDEDTCEKHGVFCCKECFNMEPFVEGPES